MGVAVALSAVVHKCGEVFSARTKDGFTLRDGATSRASSGRAEFGCSGILRSSGFLLWRMLRTTASLIETGIESNEGTEPQQEGV